MLLFVLDWLPTPVSIPQSGLQAFRLIDKMGEERVVPLFQSLNRAYKRSDEVTVGPTGMLDKLFQSLNRAYKRSDVDDGLARDRHQVFQSLNRAYKRSDATFIDSVELSYAVSIPQSGLQAFRPSIKATVRILLSKFQSLNRAYKRSDRKGQK